MHADCENPADIGNELFILIANWFSSYCMWNVFNACRKLDSVDSSDCSCMRTIMYVSIMFLQNSWYSWNEIFCFLVFIEELGLGSVFLTLLKISDEFLSPVWLDSFDTIGR